ncbi:helix-turn-helix domain-containing protein [Bacteroides sp. AN502(2024)]|uniref:helix-turn-helix domain-containing protein n=1 Tax=Bacteroides sp. AN502(2024) TaxID=3160599 RepID=UPI0035164ABF
MEQLKVLDYSNVFIASYFTEDRECAHPNAEHTLIYLVSGELEITDNGQKTILHPGDCAFMRRDNKMMLQKRVKEGVPYHSIVLKFNRKFLHEFFSGIDKKSLPEMAKRNKKSLMLLPAHRPDIRSLFESILPYFESGARPADALLQLKMIEGLYVLLNTDKNLYASLFDFTDPWKIDLLEFMNENYMQELSMEEMASYTGRSLASFKRDFKKVSEMSPLKWIINRRLEAAYDLIKQGRSNITDVCYKVGFKNLSHFSKVFKEKYGMAPTALVTA